ncbi:unnamed protein product [Didymodactylos carnosus]|uniref:Uncharacterized protein n=1 Tax=Didymodactylos carnosus TaxID=1234261 RepID=A0A815SRJ7_9BILA|nr:unnamed protein product [Didymodactylos carnosus]CAF1494324.1 unnamed protein product [Didymodactylos carnosus]CAF3847041.1 unnamed protein product [Didymodactylos carnosus]CAF4356928.1 unnamed protein product [Didymodactylos carnosus]
MMKFTLLLLLVIICLINLPYATSIRCLCKCCKSDGCTPTQVSSDDMGALCNDGTCNQSTCRVRNPVDCLTEHTVHGTCGSMKTLFNPISLMITLLTLFIYRHKY